MNPATTKTDSHPLRELFAFFLQLGLTAFGGPAAHIALMEQAAVGRGWLTREDFLDLVGGCNLLPGPSSTQVAMALAMSPSGKVLAVGGAPGLQLFHFNGASAPTLYHGNLFSSTSNPNIDQVAWDNSNHLYALSYHTGYLHATAKLYVFTVTPTSVKPAPGSPYKISGSYGAKGLIVVPR